METKNLKSSVTDAATKISELHIGDDNFSDALLTILCNLYSDGAESGFKKGYESATNVALETLRKSKSF